MGWPGGVVCVCVCARTHVCVHVCANLHHQNTTHKPGRSSTWLQLSAKRDVLLLGWHRPSSRGRQAATKAGKGHTDTNLGGHQQALIEALVCGPEQPLAHVTPLCSLLAWQHTQHVEQQAPELGGAVVQQPAGHREKGGAWRVLVCGRITLRYAVRTRAGQHSCAAGAPKLGSGQMERKPSAE